MGIMALPFHTEAPPTGEPMRLSPLVRRVLAPNPSAFTYTGTQSYVVGRDEIAVIDPGPADDAHIDALIAAVAGRPVKAILCTHTHRDHSPAAAPLAGRTGAPVIGCAPLTLDDDGPRSDAAFDAAYRPDEVMGDGATLSGGGWTIEAIATPGHTSNHLCFALREEAALFTGDHVMGWSTTVVVPPDGDMAAYMQSLEKLRGRGDRIYFPAHGAPVTKPEQYVRSLIGHRMQRERQILKLVAETPRDIPEIVANAYPGLDPRLVAAAGGSVYAHLLDLQRRGLVVVREEERWSKVE